MTKYGDMIPDDHTWEDEDEGPVEPGAPTSVDSHTVDVILTTDPTENMGYGRKKFTAHISHKDDGPVVLYFTRHRWKGNFWRDIEELDWRDVPGSVKRQVAAVVACDSVEDLNPGHRLVEEGGRSTWQREKRLEEQRAKGENK